MKRIDKNDLNTKLVKILNKTLKLMNINYKDIADELDYSGDSFIHMTLNGKKNMTIPTLINISNALINIKRRNNINIKEEQLTASYFLSKIGY